MSNFAYDAPDYFLDFSKDLASEDITKAEAFFETEHRNHNGVPVDGVICIDDSERDLDQDFFTPMKEPQIADNGDRCLRKSLSMNNLPTDDFQLQTPSDDVNTISDAMENLAMSERRQNSTNRPRKSHAMTTRADVPKLNLRTRSVSRDHLEKLAQPKRKNVSHEELQAKKYVSMAEAISQFQQKTPKRFHTKPTKMNAAPVVKACGPMPTTIPQSPALATKQRARPAQTLSREELELREYEEFKKYKIKANPINPRVLIGPVQLKSSSILKKPTQPEPFNLTEVPAKKPPSPKKPLFEFHAKPVPKSVLGPPKPIIKSALVTRPHTPKLMKRYTRLEPPKNETMVENGQGKIAQPFKGMPTKIQPFSFEQRDKEVLKKREQLVNEVLEEEKKAREFHARPLPKSIFKSPQPKSNATYYQKRQRSDGSLYKSAEDMSETLAAASTFKARPAKVLQMKPFEPKKDDQHVIAVAEFELSTYYRAREREEFEQKKREREERLAQMMKQREEFIFRQEAEEIAKLRKEAEYKAQPIRRYKEVQAMPTKKLTNPTSPKFAYDKTKKEHLIINKENLMNNLNTDA